MTAEDGVMSNPNVIKCFDANWADMTDVPSNLAQIFHSKFW